MILDAFCFTAEYINYLKNLKLIQKKCQRVERKTKMLKLEHNQTLRLKKMKNIIRMINKDFLKNPFHKPAALANPQGNEDGDEQVPPMSLATFSKIHNLPPKEELGHGFGDTKSMKIDDGNE